MIKNLSLLVENECANYYNGRCVFNKLCDVKVGKSCNYFEKAVLGPLDYNHRSNNYDYQAILTQYGRINIRYFGRGVIQRRCECGVILEYRRRCCDKCKRKKIRDSARQRMKNKRAQNVTS